MKKVLNFLVLFLFVSTSAYSQEKLLTQEHKQYLDQLGNPTQAENIPVSTNGIIKWSEGFEDATFPPAGWSVYNVDGGTKQWKRSINYPTFGTASAVVMPESQTLTNDDWLVTPQFLVENNDTLKFWAESVAPNSFDSCQIFYSTSGGAPNPGTNYFYLTTIVPAVYSQLFEVDLSSLVGQNVYIAFRYHALYQWGLYLDSVYVENSPPCPVAANPDPADGATNVSINLVNLSWTNGTGTDSVEVWFGPIGNLTQVYNGSPISSFAIPGPLNYKAKYGWRIVAKNNTCNVSGPTWIFRTELSPGTFFFEPFDDLSNWTPVGPAGTNNWLIENSNNANGESDPELVFSWYPPFDSSSSSYLKSIPITVPTNQSIILNLNHLLYHSDDPSGQMGIAVTYDDGATYTPLWGLNNPTSDVGPEQITTTFTATSSPFKLALYFIGDNFNINDWYVDDIELNYVIPVELTSLTATAIGNNVEITWSTATETNNQGFEIQRSNGGEFEVVGFIAGHGTTVEPQSYRFTDNNVGAGKYQYRLRQIDFDGKYEYSSVVEVEVIGPKEFSLAQNYPNPFNPTTVIDFNLAVDSKVTLKVFDILGQEVITLVNGNLSAGSHKVNFDASNLNSGVYLYRIEATGVDGKTFSAVKKMILNK